jgi:hypothetical protein
LEMLTQAGFGGGWGENGGHSGLAKNKNPIRQKMRIG